METPSEPIIIECSLAGSSRSLDERVKSDKGKIGNIQKGSIAQSKNIASSTIVKITATMMSRQQLLFLAAF